MISNSFYSKLFKDAINDLNIDDKRCKSILSSEEINLLELINSAFKVRHKFFGKEVTVHIINNVQDGLCSEDCFYCAQSCKSKASIEKYSMKSDKEIFNEAKIAYESGAFRYCMVFSGHGQSEKRIEKLVKIIKKIKAKFPIEVCVSPGIVDEAGLLKLKTAGLDRLNHNLNTSQKFYKKICSTHTYEDRIKTLKTASKVGLNACSGVIIGMGETHGDIIFLAKELRTLKNVKSIPINFFMPIKGTHLKEPLHLTPEYCIRILCLFRFLNPKAEIRIAAGREFYLKSMQVFGLYPANSIFMDGYLNTKGANRFNDLQMIKDAGFTIKSEQSIDKLLEKQKIKSTFHNPLDLKKFKDLHPAYGNPS